MLLEIMEREQQAAPAPRVRPPGVLRLSRSGMMKAKAQRDEIKQIADRLKVGAPALNEAQPRALEDQSVVGGMEQEGGQSVMQCTGEHCVGRRVKASGKVGGSRVKRK